LKPEAKNYFRTKNPNLGAFWRALDWKMFIYFMDIRNILLTFGIFYDNLVHFVFIWYIFSHFGIKYAEKSGNPGNDLADRRKKKDIMLTSQLYPKMHFHTHVVNYCLLHMCDHVAHIDC
jgi:hypothetical protein